METTPTITWDYYDFDTYSSFKGTTDVVFQYKYRCTATIDNNSFSTEGSVKVNLLNPSRYVSYSTLTKEIVHGWTKTELFTEGVEASTVNGLLASMSTVTNQRPAPWAA